MRILLCSAAIAGAAALTGLNKPRVVIAPAQFGVPKDYDDIKKLLLARGHPRVDAAPLSRLSWLRIVPSVFTEAFWKGELRPTPTLGFFYEALDKAFEDVGEDEEVALLGHSIGGWVARAWMAERGEKRVTRLVTLGTPHNAPPADSIVAAVDQTRGLLAYINAEFPPDPEVVTCVAGDATYTPSIFQLGEAWDERLRRSPLLESLVALPSYFALSGRNPFETRGDGLIPVETACLAGCPRVVCGAHHSDFIPTALDSIRLPETYPWYGSPGVFEEWADALTTPLAR
mmetsp:Transcript_14608/g.43630  ORF Transcript_14608/g.43630 Transcript_14608/m.43630 type:complete len:287 (+) Transcript_14608:174-1034(+)|eukprot:CAMPEP_0119290832 /NCGR_PEP_ID=MMETSP1329-20130426/41396_1 /TAXON_ID=114041 /ORGANISM="Genus nov. species nov., Strain RCC1024" /LENGTH=286 /DNA_ID=CAMNT_0007291651 /DNA_START=113 /DNA_END=973 /DNA_ORIENTATION=+